MEKDVVEAIETTTSANDEQNKELFVAVELDDTEGGGNRDKGPVIIWIWTYQYRYQQQQKLTSDHEEGCCWGNKDHHTNK